MLMHLLAMRDKRLSVYVSQRRSFSQYISENKESPLAHKALYIEDGNR